MGWYGYLFWATWEMMYHMPTYQKEQMVLAKHTFIKSFNGD